VLKRLLWTLAGAAAIGAYLGPAFCEDCRFGEQVEAALVMTTILMTIATALVLILSRDG
jgi:hypothetical protein